MKAKFLKLLRLACRVFPCFWELLKRLAIGVIKMLTNVLNWVRGYLTRAKQAYDCIATDIDEEA